MQTPVSLTDYSEALQKTIAEKIEQIIQIENFFPGVVIIHDIQKSVVVYMSKWGREFLGTTNDELRQMGTDYFLQFFNAEDAKEYVPRLIGLLQRNNDEELVSYFQQVRQSQEHDWSWFLTASRIFMHDENGAPLLTLSTSIPVDAQHLIATKAERLQEENNFLRDNNHVFDQLTKREKEILRMMALDMSSEKIAAELFISQNTANTHRRNIKRKLKIESNYDIIRFAQAFNLV